MVRYTIFANAGGLACEKRTDSVRGYISSAAAFTNFLDGFLKKNYKVKIKGDDFFLCTKDEAIKLQGFSKISDEKILEDLKRDLLYTIRRKGYVDLSDRPNNHPRRLHRSESEKVVIKVCSGVALSAGITVGVFAYTGKSVSEPASIVSSESRHSYPLGRFDDPMGRVEPISIMDQDLSMPIPVKEAYLEYSDLSSKPKALNAKENYFDLIKRDAKRFGQDENILLGIATQERGVHSKEIDEGGGLGLMQIQYDVWIGSTIDYYELNERTGEFDKKSIKITDELLESLEGNIMAGSIILQQCMRDSNYNIPMAIQMYNQGVGSIRRIVNIYCDGTDKTFEDVRDNPEDIGWLDYRSLRKGDPNYLENVMQWIKEDTFTVTNPRTGEEISFRLTNERGMRL